MTCVPKIRHSQRCLQSHCVKVPRFLVSSVVSRRMDCFQEFFFCSRTMLWGASSHTFSGAHNFLGCGNEFQGHGDENSAGFEVVPRCSVLSWLPLPHPPRGPPS